MTLPNSGTSTLPEKLLAFTRPLLPRLSAALPKVTEYTVFNFCSAFFFVDGHYVGLIKLYYLVKLAAMKDLDLASPGADRVSAYKLLLWPDFDVYSVDTTPMDFLHFWTLGHLKYLTEAVSTRTKHIKSHASAVFESLLAGNFIPPSRRQAWYHLGSFRGCGCLMDAVHSRQHMC